MARVTSDTSRIQFNLSSAQVKILDLLERKLGLRSRADLIHEALSTFVWVAQQRMRGRVVVAVAPEELDKINHAVQLAGPIAAWTENDLYEHLIARPENWRRQLWLRGRNMTVGHLIAWMRVNGMTAEEVADDFDLPLAQVHEAIAYYEAHSDLVDAELREDRRYLEREGYQVEPAPVPR